MAIPGQAIDRRPFSRPEWRVRRADKAPPGVLRRNIAQAVPGSQEETLNSEAYSIGRLVGAGLMPKDFARSVLIKAGEMMCSQPGAGPGIRAKSR